MLHLGVVDLCQPTIQEAEQTHLVAGGTDEHLDAGRGAVRHRFERRPRHGHPVDHGCEGQVRPRPVDHAALGGQEVVDRHVHESAGVVGREPELGQEVARHALGFVALSHVGRRPALQDAVDVDVLGIDDDAVGIEAGGLNLGTAVRRRLVREYCGLLRGARCRHEWRGV